MADAVIDNPILNGPYDPPMWHWRFDDSGITDEVVEGRRTSGYFVPVPQARHQGAQLAIETEWTLDRLKPNDLVNQLRSRLDLWRRQGRPHLTSTTRALLEHWSSPDRDRRLFFAQLEAAETAIYLVEAATKAGDTWVHEQLRQSAAEANPGLIRTALKMATGSGKTTVMGMLIAWQTCNSAAGSGTNFTDRFLVVAPGITVKDRLRVLLPSDPGNVYRERELVPPDLLPALRKATVVVTNFHAFGLRETREGKSASKTTKQVLDPTGTRKAFTETPEQMVSRVCREFGSKGKQVIVLNDEAHHCYRRKLDDLEAPTVEQLQGEEKKEAVVRDEEARLWLNGLLAVQRKLGIKQVYDLSATPFFLNGSGYREGLLFPWVVSDFSLVDAIESGLVKIPRVPVADDSASGDGPAYRSIWPQVRDQLSRRGRKADVDTEGERRLPLRLEGALKSLYDDYARSYDRWRATAIDGSTPPVFIVVCSNTSVSKLVFDVVAGYDAMVGDRLMPRASDFPLFSNVAPDGTWSVRPSTILVDSLQLESGGALSPEFKAAAAREIEELKADLRERFPGRDTDDLTDEAIMREVLNTVGKAGRLGEHVRCVVSVSMLTEGWDANTVTHILGVRAFGTQLLCEQVVGRGLRRRSYAVGEDGLLLPEYAEVYGVPFSFIPGSGTSPDPTPPKRSTRVRALPERADLEIRFPRVTGYRRELSDDALFASYDESSTLTLSLADLPTSTTVSGIVGQSEQHTLESLRGFREQQVAFRLAKLVLDRHLRDPQGNERPWYFPQVLPLVQEWLREHVVLKDDTFLGLLLLAQHADAAVERVGSRINWLADNRNEHWLPLLRPYDTEGSTADVDFDTGKNTFLTDPGRCPVTHVVLDSGWEQKVAQLLESLPQVAAYVKNDHLGFVIPYTLDGEQRSYLPDFLVRARVAEGDAPLTLVVEVSGATRRDKTEKVRTARDLWVPAVNAHGGFGRWRFLEVKDPYDCRQDLLSALTFEPLVPA